MKRILISILYGLCIIIFLSGQQIVENPNQPKSKNAGRTVHLEEVMRIRDDGSNSIFKIPKNLTVAHDGSIYFLDFMESSNLYKYSKDGRFFFKILKQGQGPRECQWATNFIVQEDRIRIQAWNPPKVMDYDLKGKYIEEVKIRDTHGLWFLASIEGKLYGIRDEIPHSEAIHMKGLIESPYRLYEISDDFQNWKALHDFPVEHYIFQARWPRRTMVAAAVRDNWIFMLHTAEYRVDQFDTRKAKLERVITRQYKRQKIQSTESEEDVRDRELKGFRLPPLKYTWDIVGIHTVGNTLWVVTSKPDFSDSERLIDVFDMDGVYIDSFTLQFPDNGLRHFYGERSITEDGFLFAVEQDKEGYISIGKYLIIDGN